MGRFINYFYRIPLLSWAFVMRSIQKLPFIIHTGKILWFIFLWMVCTMYVCIFSGDCVCYVHTAITVGEIIFIDYNCSRDISMICILWNHNIIIPIIEVHRYQCMPLANAISFYFIMTLACISNKKLWIYDKFSSHPRWFKEF